MIVKDSRFKKILEITWVLIVLGAGSYYIVKNLDTVRGYFLTLPLYLPVLTFALITISKLLIARMAQLTLAFSDEEINYPEMLNIVAITQLGKYLPGGIWHFVGRFGIYQQRGIEKLQTGKLMLLENLWLVISAIGTALLLFQLSGNEISQLVLGPFASWSWVLWIVFILCIVAIWLMPWILFKKTQKLRFWLELAFWMLIIWVSYGVSYALLLGSFELDGMLALAASFNLSWAGGYLIVFAPAGIGIREVILALFATALTISEGPVISVFHRLIWTAVEIILGLISIIIKQVGNNESHHTDSLPE